MTETPEIQDHARRLLGLLERAIVRTHHIVEGIGPANRHAATPCEGVDAHGLVEHLVGGLNQFAEVGEGRAPETPEFGASFDDDAATREYDSAGDHMMSVWSDPEVANRSYPMPWGEMEGWQLLSFMLIEQVMHGWDLARATGQSAGYDDDLVEDTLAMCVAFDGPAIRTPELFGPIVPIGDDAPVIDRLAAFLGRDPARWPG